MVNYKLVSASVTYKIDHLFNNFITRPKLDCLTGKSIDKNYSLHMSTGQQESVFYPLYYLVTMQEINSIKSFLWKLKRQDFQSLTLMPFSSIPNDRFLSITDFILFNFAGKSVFFFLMLILRTSLSGRLILLWELVLYLCKSKTFINTYAFIN